MDVPKRTLPDGRVLWVSPLYGYRGRLHLSRDRRVRSGYEDAW
jgi:hypothetical protein